MPFGEGRSHITAFNIAVGDAISLIRGHKASDLEGTSYMAIPHDSAESKEVLDHTEMIQENPALVARYMDRYNNLVHTYYNTQQLIL